MNEVGVTDDSGANEIEVTELSQGSPASESEPEVKSGGGLNHHSPRLLATCLEPLEGGESASPAPARTTVQSHSTPF